MSVSAAEVGDVAKRMDGFMKAWGQLNLDTMQGYCHKKLRGKLGAGIKGGVVSFFTDEILAILGALWSAERAHFLLRYDSFVGKGKWFQRPMMGPSSKRIDSVYAQVIDRIEKVLQLVDHMYARAPPSQLHVRGQPAQGHRDSLTHIRDSLDHVGRIAKVRAVMVPIYRSILANARPMADIDIVELLDTVKEKHFYIVPTLVAHQAWYNCTFEIQALLLACTASRAICAYDFKASVVAMRRSDAFTNRWNSLILGSEHRQIPLIRWFELMRAHRVDKMAVYFFNLWQTCASHGNHMTSAWSRGHDGASTNGRRQGWAGKHLYSSVGHRFKVPEVASGLFHQLSVSVRNAPLVKTIANFIDRCYNEYSEHDADHWGADVPAQGLGNDMDVSVNILLDAASLQRDRQTEPLNNEERKSVDWHREATSAYLCPEVAWCDQYESKRIVDEKVCTPAEDLRAQVPLSGLNSYPAMMHMAHRAVASDAPASRLRHWPNLISFITGRDPSPHREWLFNRPFYHYEMKLHTTFFIFSPDPHVYLCVVCQHQKRVIPVAGGRFWLDFFS
eukprot:INCI5075.3.p1 GENE.INCI5075.3~~INCI5075.3.p1  ORF type:complete len:560 (-),score=74.40 INCI5075.3:871-2550(-)